MSASFSLNWIKTRTAKVAIKDVQELLRTLVEALATTGCDVGQFRLYDTDGDEIVTESESQKILDSMILTQKAVLAELFATHVDQMPKKHMKLLDIAVNETNWKEKLPEKVRCVFYFAPKEDEEDKTVCWEAFKESQEAELPELNDIVRVYAKGYYDDRHLFFERKQRSVVFESRVQL
ncbi:hypothetical protein Poli38472_014864 [Pythium oligandrum]|uniref:Uncharacterized protein n=1 Tax=Pythium oligandrum TaxID=41045 RepID=A0A8K1FFI0_PYTOL|nr:hypothetical protein Poli38472_014864 [Pythium oligandrum]|eukprot:TMW57677.1 hypothetical protein Poli38472_014864 [Pythium oligandrum]